MRKELALLQKRLADFRGDVSAVVEEDCREIGAWALARYEREVYLEGKDPGEVPLLLEEDFAHKQEEAVAEAQEEVPEFSITIYKDDLVGKYPGVCVHYAEGPKGAIPFRGSTVFNIAWGAAHVYYGDEERGMLRINPSHPDREGNRLGNLVLEVSSPGGGLRRFVFDASNGDFVETPLGEVLGG